MYRGSNYALSRVKGRLDEYNNMVATAIGSITEQFQMVCGFLYVRPMSAVAYTHGIILTSLCKGVNSNS